MYTLLSPLQRTALFDPPGNLAVVQRLYMLGPEDLAGATPAGSGPPSSSATCVTPVGLLSPAKGRPPCCSTCSPPKLDSVGHLGHRAARS